jgi:hypothetical protein
VQTSKIIRTGIVILSLYIFLHLIKPSDVYKHYSLFHIYTSIPVLQALQVFSKNTETVGIVRIRLRNLADLLYSGKFLVTDSFLQTE